MKLEGISVRALGLLLLIGGCTLPAAATTTVRLDSGGSYEFDGPAADPTAFRIDTAGGELSINVVRLKATPAPRRLVTFSLASSPETATYLETANDGVTKRFTISYDSHGFQKFSSDLRSGAVDLLESRIPDCAALERSEIFQALTAAALTIGADFEHKQERAIPISGDQWALTGALVALTATLAYNPECNVREIHTSECARNSTGHANLYTDCQLCCAEAGPGPLGFLCAAVTVVLCQGPWCAGGAIIGCGGIIEFEQSACEENNCTGLSGDPGCRNPPPCAGVCYVDPGCGILRCGECGLCENDSMRCCGPC